MVLIKKDTHIEPALSVEGHIPSREEIRNRFAKKFRSFRYDLDPVLVPCSEEAEKMLIELKNIIEVGVSVNIKRKGRATYLRHYCPVCKTKKIYPSYFFCPHCGTKVIWIDQQ
jgi:predicted RNA-binding Zn-ribbon protein involved in translation (DUF1610 family)